jgi:5-hydroxyisourate hydrolase
MTTISTHVLDATSGRPAEGMAVILLDAAGGALAGGRTDADGRVGDLAGELPAGEYALRFATGAWHRAQGRESFHPSVTVAFQTAGEPHLHVPLLLSPYSYTTYRGS